MRKMKRKHYAKFGISRCRYPWGWDWFYCEYRYGTRREIMQYISVLRR